MRSKLGAAALTVVCVPPPPTDLRLLLRQRGLHVAHVPKFSGTPTEKQRESRSFRAQTQTDEETPREEVELFHNVTKPVSYDGRLSR